MTNHAKGWLILLYGGKSPEHDISRKSASFIYKHWAKEDMELYPVAIDKQGRWLPALELCRKLDKETLTELPVPKGEERTLLGSGTPLDFLLDFLGPQEQDLTLEQNIAVFPMLHGRNGEDGRIQSLCELAGIPCVGPDSLSSAISMNKVCTKRLLEESGIPTSPYLSLKEFQWETDKSGWTEKVQKKLKAPYFVKPASCGSSIGVERVLDSEGLVAACEKAFQYDQEILIEEEITPLRELELAILGGDVLECTVPCEVLAGDSFYSYEEKYSSESQARIEVPAKLTKEQVKAARDLALKTAYSLGIQGMARIDLFFDSKNQRFLVNEVNTIPGFTSISQYPALWAFSGVGPSKLLERLVEICKERQLKMNALKLS